MGEQQLEAKRGDTWYWQFEITELDLETPQDITGATFRFTVKESVADADADAVALGTSAGGECQVTDGPSGVMSVKIPASATQDVTPGRYAYDLQARDGAGDVWTPMWGTLVVLPDVSRDIT